MGLILAFVDNKHCFCFRMFPYANGYECMFCWMERQDIITIHGFRVGPFPMAWVKPAILRLNLSMGCDMHLPHQNIKGVCCCNNLFEKCLFDGEWALNRSFTPGASAHQSFCTLYCLYNQTALTSSQNLPDACLLEEIHWCVPITIYIEREREKKKDYSEKKHLRANRLDVHFHTCSSLQLPASYVANEVLHWPFSMDVLVSQRWKKWELVWFNYQFLILGADDASWGAIFQIGMKPHPTTYIVVLATRAAREIREILGQYAEQFGDLGVKGHAYGYDESQESKTLPLRGRRWARNETNM